MKILLIAGGWSSERKVSLNGARNIEQELRTHGHEVTFFDLREEFGQLLEQAAIHDFAFINLHGAPGEDGLVQAMLDTVNCPYQGSGPAGSFLALNKAATKQVYRQNGLPTPDWEFVTTMPDDDWEPALAYPLFVKSNTGGSSLHLKKANNRRELENALREIFAAGEEAIMEHAINGRDMTCGVLANEALPPVLIEPVGSEYFDYKAKYAKEGAREICPAPVSEELKITLQKYALMAHNILGLRGYSRTDFIVDDNGPTLLETNTLPGMTATSLVPQEAACIGLDFGQLLERLIALGINDCNKK